jgi:hypothetical protein
MEVILGGWLVSVVHGVMDGEAFDPDACREIRFR